MSSHRLPIWAPENNYVYNDLNRAKPEIYRGRFLQHDGASYQINRSNNWTRKQQPQRSHDIISGTSRPSNRRATLILAWIKRCILDIWTRRAQVVFLILSPMTTKSGNKYL